MNSILYQRIKDLCAKKGISVSKLESDLGFGNSSIKKWEKVSSPSVDKISKIANYFGVSVDYLLGRTDILNTNLDTIEDEDIISFQRARQKMTDTDRKRMMQILKIGFDYAFQEDDENK